MTFTPDQLERRRGGLGASEIAAVSGLNPYKNAIDVFLVKTGMVTEDADNRFTRWGNRLEAVIADEYAEQEGATLFRCETVWHPTEPWFCTPDRLRLVPKPPQGIPNPITTLEQLREAAERGLECKSRGSRQSDKWGEPGTDQIPHDVACQAHWSMMVTGLKRWDVAVLIGGNDFRTYTLLEDKEIQAGLVETARWFWSCVKANEPSQLDGSESAHRYLALKFPTHDADLVETTPEIDAVLGEMRMGQMELKAAEERISRAQVAIKQVCGDHAGLATRRAKVTWLKNAKGTAAWKEIALEAGATDELIARHTPEGSRVLRVKWSGEASD